MSYCPDNYDLWEAHDAKQAEWLKRRPVCCHCDQHIQEETCYRIEGEIYCRSCLDTVFMVETEEVMDCGQ